MTWKLRPFVTGAISGGWENLSDKVSGIVIRAEVHGGVQTIEFRYGDNYTEAYRWAYDHLGCHFALFDNSVTPPVAEGQILERSLTEGDNRVTVFGPWMAYCFAQAYNDTATWIAAGTTSAQIKDMLSSECPGVNTNQDNIDETSTNNFPWQPSDNAYPGDLIPQLAALGDATYREWFFWLKSAPLIVGNRLTNPIPWFKPKGSLPYRYQCYRHDATPGGLDLDASLGELANDVRVMYRDAAGTQQQTASAIDLDSQSRYGLRERWDMDLGPASATAAAQYGNMLLAELKDARQWASFTLNTWLYDKWGGKWPLWRAIADFPVIISVVDLVPDNTVSQASFDKKRTFATLACEYDYDSNELTITPDTQDNRADALLARHRMFQ